MVHLNALAILPLAASVAAETLNIPSVDSAVAAALSAYGNYHAVVAPTTTNSTLRLRKRQSSSPSYWLEGITQQGLAPYGPSNYTVFRNVKDYGAKGDGVTDDTAAINEAISSGGRCGEGCASSTTTPATVYFPAGTYVISTPIIDYYFTQIIGNPNDLPVIKASSSFNGGWLIDGDPYYTANLNWGSTNVFYRQIRNFIMDLTDIPVGNSVSGIHWPTAQATSLQNIVFELGTQAGVKTLGLFIESGSAGYLGDLIFNGGYIGAGLGNQQYTMRNLTFNNVQTAISHFWSWGWTYKNIVINNASVGIDVSGGGSSAQAVGSITVLDSSFTNTEVAIKTAHDSTSQPAAAGSVVLENIAISNVPVVVQGPSDATVLAGSSCSQVTIAAWGQGHTYSPAGPTNFQGSFAANTRPASLVSGDGGYYYRSKPQYETYGVSSFSSVRSGGAKGDGTTDDTAALQKVINDAASAGNIVYIDTGVYVVTSTLNIPAGSKIVGEGYPVILGNGSYFSDSSNPQAVVQVGTPGETGQVEWSDTVVATRGATAGAVLVQWNLASPADAPSGVWDVHARVGGFTGSDLQTAQCQDTPNTAVSPGGSVNKNCIAAYMLFHVTPQASGLYLENVWLWTADHDMDDSNQQQITIYSGRGLNIESTEGNIWLSGTAVEHNTLYQYQFANTQNVYAGQIQTETPYYQPNPVAPTPFSTNSSINDPTFTDNATAEAWGLRVLNSNDILIYGASHYAFFINNNGTCATQSVSLTAPCQQAIASVEGSSSGVSVYNLNTISSASMINVNGSSVAKLSDNLSVYNEGIALFRL